MLDGTLTLSLEGEALGALTNMTDFLLASWGPRDDGKTVEGPGKKSAAAFLHGIKQV